MQKYRILLGLAACTFPAMAIADSGHGFRGEHLHGGEIALVVVTAVAVITAAVLGGQNFRQAVQRLLPRWKRK